MRQYLACFGQELHETTDRRHCAGMRYVDSMSCGCRKAEEMINFISLIWKVTEFEI